MSPVDIHAYLERIGYTGSLTPGPDVLRDLQLAHLYTVPFENLSIHAREPIVLDDEALFEKIVRRRRGGFCYEANGLFAALLRTLGFDVVMLSAGVAHATGGFSPEFDHMALMVTLDERWLVDVGFGDTFREPLRLEIRTDQPQGRRAYRIEDGASHWVLMHADRGGDWTPQYRFTLRPYGYADFAGMCRYHQTSPKSHFTQNRICTLATPDGRITLSDMRLIATSDTGGRDERVLGTQEEYDAVLRERFGIQITR